MSRRRRLRDVLKGPGHVLYHVFLIVLSASIALSLPAVVNFIAGKFLVYWAVVGSEEIFLTSIEIALAVTLVFTFNYLGSSWKDRRLARMAKSAGLVFVSSARGFLAKRRHRRIKEDEGIARDLMLIGSTGHRTFTDERGELHNVIRQCRQAKVMLLNPYSEGASIRAKGILDPDISLEIFRCQIRLSIDFLKELRGLQKNIRLKLYDDTPFLKLAISGDFIWMKRYHPGLDVQCMPEFVFRHNANPGSLYATFYEYFQLWWNNPGIPEYDLDTDELVYRDRAGNEERRERLFLGEDAGVAEETAGSCPGSACNP